jgi:hypothetical protein
MKEDFNLILFRLNMLLRNNREKSGVDSTESGTVYFDFIFK